MKTNLSFLQFVLFSILLVKSAHAAPKKIKKLEYKVAVQNTSVNRVVVSRPTIFNLEVMGGMSAGENSSDITFAGGVGLQYVISDFFSVGPEILYLQKNANVQSNLITMNSLEIPLLAKLKFGSSVAKIELFAGPSVGFAMSTQGIPDTMKESLDPTAPEFSIHAGVGVRFNLSGNTSIFSNGRYIKSLSSSNQFEQPEVNSSGLLFLSGLSFSL